MKKCYLLTTIFSLPSAGYALTVPTFPVSTTATLGASAHTALNPIESNVPPADPTATYLFFACLALFVISSIIWLLSTFWKDDRW